MLKNTLEALSSNRQGLFDTNEASQLFGKTKSWFERHRWAGTGPKFIRIGKTPYYSGQSLLEFLIADAEQSSNQPNCSPNEL